MAFLLGVAFWFVAAIAKSLTMLLPPGLPLRWTLPRAIVTFLFVQWVGYEVALSLAAPNTALHAVLVACAIEFCLESWHWLRVMRLRRALTAEEFRQLLTQMRMRP